VNTSAWFVVMDIVMIVYEFDKAIEIKTEILKMKQM